VRILVTRPLADGEAIARRLADMGHRALLAPLLTPRFLEGPVLDLSQTQAILITSANGVRALAGRTPKRDIPIYAVGPQSAQAARGEGFLRVRSAAGDAGALAQAVSGWADPAAGVLLHAAGEEAGDGLCQNLTAHGFATRRANLYRMEKAVHLPAAATLALRQGEVDAALFFSPKSAALFAECARRDGVSAAGMTAICISANTAEALKDLRLADIRIAAAPNQDALLACL